MRKFAVGHDRFPFLGRIAFDAATEPDCQPKCKELLPVSRAANGLVSPLMAGLLRAYVHHSHRRHGFVDHRWQGRFKNPAVACSEYLLSCGRTIERDLVEVGLVP